jgi:hypothetical protein
MPKATVHKNGYFPPSHNDVRRACEVAAMEPISVALAGECFPNQKLGLGVLAANAGHHSAARFRIDDISQEELY